jgi:hypothetical protein
MGNNDEYTVCEKQKGIPKISYKALKARGKTICARRVTLQIKFLNVYKGEKKRSKYTRIHNFRNWCCYLVKN